MGHFLKKGSESIDKELTAEEKEYKTKRKEIQEKLIKFATRVPIFMYLTDYREQCLKDVITQLEPGLFKKVTGLDVKDFNLLCSIGVFNSAVMNDAIWNFKRYEDASLSYTGIDKHEGEGVGLWDTSLSYYDAMAKLLSESQVAKKRDKDDRPEVLYREYAKDDEDETGAPVIEVRRAVEPEHKVPTASTTKVGGYTAKPAVKKVEPVAKTTITIDFDKIKVGAKVYHKAFGEGIIESLDGEAYIKVKFGDSVKTFKNPDAFIQGFLRTEN